MGENTTVITLADVRDKLETDEEIKYFDNHKDYFEEYLNKINNYTLMDFNVEIKRFGNRLKAIDEDIFQADGHKMFTDKMMEAQLLADGYDESTIASDGMLLLKTDPGEYMYSEKLRKYKEGLVNKQTETNISIKMCEYLKSVKYTDTSNTNEIDILVEKLENDIRMLKNSSDINKEKTIKNIEIAIDIIQTMPKQFLLDTIPTDKRAKKILKQYDPKVISKIFGPNTSGDFVFRLMTDLASEDITCEQDAALLLLFHMAKKIETSMKATDYKSLVYRAYIVQYLNICKSESVQSIAMSRMFHDVMNGYIKNDIIKHGSAELAFKS